MMRHDSAGKARIAPGLYLITPDWEDTQRLLETTEAALRGGVSLLQYRNKSASRSLLREQATALRALCRWNGCPFIVNDHLDLCLETDADGVHVGASDTSVANAVAALGPEKIVGASCYGSLGMAEDAYCAGASYIALGGFYPSRVKQYEVATRPEAVSMAVKRVPVPTVVIGGMTPANAAPLVDLGAHLVAAISGIYGADSPEAAARSYVALFRKGGVREG